MKTLVFTLLFYIAFQVNAQVTDTTKLSNVKLSLEGMIGFSVGQNFYSLNVGGPSLFLHINKNLKIRAFFGFSNNKMSEIFFLFFDIL